MSSIGLATAAASEGSSRSNRRSRNFHLRYLALCRAGNFKPIAEIANPKRTNAGSSTVLDVYGDRFTANDWKLIAQALSEDRSLVRLALRLRKSHTEAINGSPQQQQQQQKHSVGDGNQASNRPAVLEMRILKSLVENLSQFLKTNRKIETFALEGIPLSGVWMFTLANGLKRNSSLNELNLARCSIGDEGCEMLCRELKTLPNVQVLNLSACQLTARACQALASTIRFQKIQRFDASWAQSLRYGAIEEDKLFGLKYLLLSHNPAIGDAGLLELTEVLKDDAWVRQVYFCHCGLTDAGAQMLLECLNLNATIEKFDIRENFDISNAACQGILEKLGVQDFEAGGDDLDPLGATKPKKGSTSPASLRQRCEMYEAQLESERERYSQLESTTAQLHLRLGDYAMQMSELQRQLTTVVNERNELQSKLEAIEQRRPVATVGALRKTQSELRATAGETIQPAIASMSEMMMPCSSPHLHAAARMSRIIEASAGDTGRLLNEEPMVLQQPPKPAQGDGFAMGGWEPDDIIEPACDHLKEVSKGDPCEQQADRTTEFSVYELLHSLSKLDVTESDL